MVKKVVILGGTLPHRDLAIKFKEIGFFVILIDYYDNPIAADISDKHYKISTLDIENVTNICVEEGVDFVVSLHVDQANVTASHVSNILKLPHLVPNDVDILFSEKSKFKKFFKDICISTPDYIVASDFVDIKDMCFNFPIVTKPDDGNGSKGVRISNNKSEFFDFFQQSKKSSRNGMVLCEEFIDGQEYSSTIIKQGEKIIIYLHKKIRSVSENKILQTSGGFSHEDDSMEDRIRTIFVRVLKNLPDIKNCFFFAQFIIKNDVIYFIDASFRLGGGLSYKIFNFKKNIDIQDVFVNFILNKEFDIEIRNDSKIYKSIVLCYNGIFDEISFDESLTRSFCVLRRSGDEILPTGDSRNRLAIFIVDGDSVSDCWLKENALMKSIKINGKNL